MNSKRKGTAREHRSIALLEAAGYRCTRAASVQQVEFIRYRFKLPSIRWRNHGLSLSPVDKPPLSAGAE